MGVSEHCLKMTEACASSIDQGSILKPKRLNAGGFPGGSVRRSLKRTRGNLSVKIVKHSVVEELAPLFRARGRLHTNNSGRRSDHNRIIGDIVFNKRMRTYNCVGPNFNPIKNGDPRS